MQTKELNAAIVEKLSAAAQEYFKRLTDTYDEQTIKVGTYSATEIVKECKYNEKHNLPVYTKIDDCGECKVDVGTFQCEFPMYRIFEILDKFEKLAKIPTAKKAKFVRSAKVEAVAEFIITFPKSAKELAKYASKDIIRPAMCGVCIDTANAAIVATDTHVLGESRAEIELISGEHTKILISAKDTKALAGQTAIIEVQPDRKVIITADNGAIFNAEVIKNYPNYRRVVPQVTRKGYFKLTKDGKKQFTAFVKDAAKHDIQGVTISIVEGASVMQLSFREYIVGGRTAEIELTEPARCDMKITISVNSFASYASAWAGGLWITDNARPFVVDCDGMEYTIVMPSPTPEQYSVEGERINAMERHTAQEAQEAEAVKSESVTEPAANTPAAHLDTEYILAQYSCKTPVWMQATAHSRNITPRLRTIENKHYQKHVYFIPHSAFMGADRQSISRMAETPRKRIAGRFLMNCAYAVAAKTMASGNDTDCCRQQTANAPPLSPPPPHPRKPCSTT